MQGFPFLLALSVLTFAQSHDQAGQATSDKCTIEGTVLRAATDEPLKKAWVTLQNVEHDRQPHSSSTDASGRFALKDIEPGRYILRVSRNGYVSQAYGQRGSDQPGTTLSLTAGQNLRDITFRLIPAAVITGHVYDEEGEPIAGGMVQAMRYRYNQGQRDLVPAGMDRADDRGEYRIFGLPPGQYYVSAVIVPAWDESGMTFGGGNVGSKEESYTPTYYPGTSDPARATPLELRAGEEVGAIDILFMPTRAVRVRGRVLNAVTGQPGQGVNLFLFPRDSGATVFMSARQAYVQDKGGAFEIAGVTPGSYTLEGHWWSENKDYVARLPLDVGTADIEDVNLVISPGVPLSGRVRVESSSKIKITDLVVYAITSGRSTWFSGQEGKVKEDGSFLLPNVSEGEYEIGIGGMPEDAYLKSARLEGEDILEKGLEIGAGQALGTLELTIASPAGRVEGLVLKQDQQPSAGARVVLVPDGPRRTQRRLYHEISADQYGRFTMSGITPGGYKIFAWEEIESGAYQDSELLMPYEDLGVPVSVKEGDQLTLQVELIPADANLSH